MSEPHPNQEIVVTDGQLAPDFTLPDTDGRLFALSTAVTNGPVIVVFYRGDW